jgi:CPA1 family monovalent cation:H+ antiporter
VELGESIVGLIELLMIAASVAIIVKFTKFPYTIALVLAGLFVGISGILPEIPLMKELVFTLILPPLLFEAALNMDIQDLRENFKPISSLALLGVIVSTLFIGFTLNHALGIPLELSLLFGAMISPTDPVSVLATFKSLSAPKRLSTILEGESILNDGAAIVVFAILLEMLESGNINLVSGIAEFFIVCIGGVAVGLAVGYLAYRVLASIDDPFIEIAITIILAYSSFLISEHFHVSGVIAVVAAGLVIGNYGKIFSMSPSTRVILVDFWSVIVFLINSIVFILIGINTHLNILSAWKEILVAILAVTFARALVVYPVMTIWRFPSLWKHVVFWGGLRGVIPVALALSLAENKLISAMTFGVVIFSLVCQGVTLEMFVRRKFKDVKREKIEEVLARFIAAKSAKFELQRAVESGRVVEPVAERLMEDIDREIEESRKELERVLKEEDGVELIQKVKRYVLDAKKSAVREATARGVISHDVAEKLLREIDIEISQIYGE